MSYEHAAAEEEIMDFIFEHWPEDSPKKGISVYNRREGGPPRAECYITLDGKCYQLVIRRHPHPLEGDYE